MLGIVLKGNQKWKEFLTPPIPFYQQHPYGPYNSFYSYAQLCNLLRNPWFIKEVFNSKEYHLLDMILYEQQRNGKLEVCNKDSRDLGYSIITLKRHIKSLEEKGLIECKKYKGYFHINSFWNKVMELFPPEEEWIFSCGEKYSSLETLDKEECSNRHNSTKRSRDECYGDCWKYEREVPWMGKWEDQPDHKKTSEYARESEKCRFYPREEAE